MLDKLKEIEKEMGLSGKVRICFGGEHDSDKRVFRKMLYIIPIIESGGKFMTFQDLSYEKMTGVEPLSPEEKKKYPVVVNPEIPYKVKHNNYLYKSNDLDRIKIVLAYMSGKIAIDKSSYLGGDIHDGYFVDEERSAKETLTIHDKKKMCYDILSAIPSEHLDVYCTVAKLQKGVKIEDFNNLTNDLLRSRALYSQIDEDPNIILQLDETNNPNFKEQIFIAFAEKNEIIRRRGVEFYLIEDGVVTTPMGKTINQVVSYLRDNVNTRDYIMKHLSEKEQYYAEKSDDIIYSDTDVEKVKNMIYVAITGGHAQLPVDAVRAEEYLNILYKTEGNSEDYIKLKSLLLTELCEKDIEEFSKDYQSWTLENIQGHNLQVKDPKVQEGLKALKKFTDKEADDYKKLLAEMQELMLEAKTQNKRDKLQESINKLSQE